MLIELKTLFSWVESTFFAIEIQCTYSSTFLPGSIVLLLSKYFSDTPGAITTLHYFIKYLRWMTVTGLAAAGTIAGDRKNDNR